jgi:hypothetical protein
MSLNPFEPMAGERLDAHYRWPAEALAFLDGAARCLQVIGVEGAGKTTLLELLAARLRAAGEVTTYLYVPLDGSVTAPAPTGGTLLVDEADRLAPGVLSSLLKPPPHLRLVLATHRDLRTQIRRAGLTALTVRLLPLRDAREVLALWQERLALAGCGEACFGEIAAREALRLTRGNPLRCVQLGYELWEDTGGQEVSGPEDVRRAWSALNRALRAAGA